MPRLFGESTDSMDVTIKRELDDFDADLDCVFNGPERKRNRRSIDLDLKLTVIRLYEEGEHGINIARKLNLPPSTVRTIRQNADKIKAGAKNATSLNAKKITRSRNAHMENMESLLAIWIEDQSQRNIPLTKTAIQEKAKSLYGDLIAKEGESSNTREEFGASRGWLERFRRRANLSGLSLNGLNVSLVSGETERFINEFKLLIEEGGYCPKQVFNVDETGLFWKRLPAKTSISMEEKSAPGFKPEKERLSLLLGGNAEGDFKFKPLLVYHSQTPKALKGYSKEHLRVSWRCNNKSWLTATIFEEWLNAYAIPALKDYCASENLPFKILFLLDRAPSHAPHLQNLSEDVKFIFLPQNTNSLLQPMDQGVISAFKACYLQRVVQQLLNTGKDDIHVGGKEFWKDYNILKAIDNVADAWDDVSASFMNSAWDKVWPECIIDCDSTDDIFASISGIENQISELCTGAGLKGMEVQDIKELLDSHKEELTNDELILLDDHIKMEDEDETKSSTAISRVFTVKRLAEFFKHIDAAMEIINEDDANRERSCRVLRAVCHEVNCYKEIYLEKIKNQKKKKILGY